MTKGGRPAGAGARAHRRPRRARKSVPLLPIRRPDLEAVERIVKATLSAPGGEKFDATCIDRKALKDDLCFAQAQYGAAREFGSTTLANQRDKRWRDIHETARKLLKLLREDARDRRGIGPYYPMTAPAPRSIILSVAFAAIACRRRPKGNPTIDLPAQDVVRWMTARSPADFLAGELLPRLFAEYFGERAGYTTKEGDTDSPAIRFAEQTFRECGITHGNGDHYQRSFFAAAQTNARQGRSRRKRPA